MGLSEKLAQVIIFVLSIAVAAMLLDAQDQFQVFCYTSEEPPHISLVHTEKIRRNYILKRHAEGGKRLVYPFLICQTNC